MCCDVACVLIHSQEGVVTPQIVEAVLSIPATAHVGILQTSVLLLGQLGGWLNKRRSTPYLGNSFHATTCCVY